MERIGIIGAGNWIVDQIKQMDRWPGEGNLADIIREEPPAGGGGPNNVLHDLAAMDPSIPLYAVGRIGNDPAGEFLLAEARKDRTLVRRRLQRRHVCPGVRCACARRNRRRRTERAGLFLRSRKRRVRR